MNTLKLSNHHLSRGGRISRVAVMLFALILGFVLMQLFTPAKASAAETANINFYVSVNDKWEQIDGETKQVPVEKIKVPGKSYTTYAISVDELEKYYEKFNYRAWLIQTYVNPTAFRHAKVGDSYAWADRWPILYNGKYYVQLLTNTPNCDIYYLPNDAASREAKMNMKDSSIIKRNTFYTLDLESAEGVHVSLDTQYCLNTQKFNITLSKLPSDLVWGSDQIDTDPIGTITSEDDTWITYELTLTQGTVIKAKRVSGSGTSTGTTTGTINFYASIDGKWQKLGGSAKQVTIHSLPSPGKGYNTYAISAAELEKIYGEYGFKVSDLKAGSTMFRHAKVGEGNMWGDRAAFTYNGQVYVQLLGADSSTSCDLYYLPNEGSNTTDKLSTTNQTIIKNNAVTKNEEPAVESTTGNINFYASIDGKWQKLGGSAKKTTIYSLPSPGKNYNTYAISASELEKVYGEYGFKASDLKAGSTMFRHAKVGDNTMWCDRTPFEYNGEMYVQLLVTNISKDCDIYYLPNEGSNKSDYLSTTNQTIIKNNAVTKNEEPAVESTTGNINFYASIDGKWQKLGGSAKQTTIYSLPSPGKNYNTYAISASELEKVYGEYGFKASDLKAGSTMFRHAKVGESSMWCDRTPFEYNGEMYVQLLVTNISKDCDIYYLPNEGSNTSDSLSTTNQTIIKNNDVTKTEPTVEPTEQSASINFYVSVNEKWQKVGGSAKQVTVQKIKPDGQSAETYAISTEQLAEIYKDYNFQANLVYGNVNTTVFRYASTGSSTAWANRKPFTYEGKTYVQLLTTDNSSANCDVYYLPNDGASYDAQKNIHNTTLVKNNTFYTVDIQSAEGVNIGNTGTSYVLSGTAFTMSLPKLPSGLVWGSDQISGDSIGTVVSETSTHTTYSVNITQATVIKPVRVQDSGEDDEEEDEDDDDATVETTGTINFYVPINEEWVKIGGSAKQVPVEKVKVPGQDYETYVISTTELAKIYKDYNFTTDLIYGNVNTTMFRYATNGSSTAYVETGAFSDSGKTYVALPKNTPNCNLYYLPNDGASYDVQKNINDASVLKGNTFYTVEVLDVEGNQLGFNYCLTGYPSYMTLPALPNGLTWGSDQISGAIGTVISSSEYFTTYAVTPTQATVIRPM